jgi:alpha-galactosidase
MVHDGVRPAIVPVAAQKTTSVRKYLKWDNNLWVNCDRAGHGHGSADGNFAHVTALYQMLAALRQRCPNLIIERCSQGGNRLDFGMLRLTDTAWMDDRTAPSVHVRHNFESLSEMFPPAYLLSFVTDHVGESIEDAQDLSLYFRSRMAGILGLCLRAGALSDRDAAGIQGEIATYKSARSIQSDGSAALLSQQADVSNGPAWDVLQETSVDGAVLLFAVENVGAGSDSTNVVPRDLQAAVTYLVRSVDTGALGEATGADLMADGIAVLQSPTSASHLLMLVPEKRAFGDSAEAEHTATATLVGLQPDLRNNADGSRPIPGCVWVASRCRAMQHSADLARKIIRISPVFEGGMGLR